MPHPIEFLIALAASSLLTIGTGFVILRAGLKGLAGRELPLTKNKSVTGLPARVAGSIMTFFGAVFLLAGLITIPLCLWQIWVLANK